MAFSEPKHPSGMEAEPMANEGREIRGGTGTNQLDE
jgi:hypothetical protein